MNSILGLWYLVASTMEMAAICSAATARASAAAPLSGDPEAAGHPFPAALLAEPLELQAHHSHLTRPFVIRKPTEQWNVALGFIRADSGLVPGQRMDGGTDICRTNPSREIHRPFDRENTDRGLSLRWELLRSDGLVVAQYFHDRLIPRDLGWPGVYLSRTVTRTLSGFANQEPGTYQLRVTVLRGARELDLLKPHIVVEVPLLLRPTSAPASQFRRTH